MILGQHGLEMKNSLVIQYAGAQPGEVSWNKGTQINISSTTHERKALQRKMLEIFLLDTFKTAFQMKNLTHR